MPIYRNAVPLTLTVILGLHLAVFTHAAFLFLPSTGRSVSRSFITTRTLQISHSASRVSTPKATASTPLYLFGGLSGDDSSSDDKEAELAKFSGLAQSDVKYDSLSEYVNEWASLFQDSKAMGLTTPVNVLPSSAVPEENVASVSGVRIVFKKTQTGSAYRSKEEEREVEKQGGSSYKAPSDKKNDAKLEGGVEVLVEKLQDGTVQVRARRCDIDEDTMIKEMSEETIIKELKKAIDVWKKQ